MNLSELIAKTAEAEIGVHETSPNSGERIATYQLCTWLPVGPWPWCAAFVDYCVAEAVAKFGKVTFPLPKTAGAWDLENWCRSVDNSVKLKKPHDGDIKRGDIIIFEFSHTGIALDSPKDGYVTTCEGNTNVSGSREGDGVYKKTRSISKIRSRIRFIG